MSPLFFVIGIEYLSRILKALREVEYFTFHLRCSKLSLNHLAFVIDLMLFYKRVMQSIKILIQGVEFFSSSSKLFANYTKLEIYLAGVSNEFREMAANSLDFTFESLPVKYLGMPLPFKRYTVADCEYLVDKNDKLNSLLVC